ncbi:hypothetical protein L1987_44183 [Smallanthus sonchifolius]|uniref:Uncharacterized protein n=1 Tax=Smallanthus sonchifolius TaxID=185202 RepID=A0ACB9GPS1_9ASTR|nr:hypothetical protein L1987_44183 [Smallanthus sonchifolius]
MQVNDVLNKNNVGDGNDKPKPKVACVETGSSPIAGLMEEQYQLFLNHLREEAKTTDDDPSPIANMAGISYPHCEWLVDSGATEHITHRGDFLENKVSSLTEAPVTIPNGDTIPVTGKGEHTLQGGVKIKDVLHVPGFNCNLLSVRKLTKDLNCAITFFPDFFVMQDLVTRKFIGAGNCIGGMGAMKGERKALMASFDAQKIGMLDFYAQEGILLETSCPHTLQQNGVVEHKHRHLLETARALQFEANLPKRFWGECILTTTYVVNRLPSKVTRNITPYEGETGIFMGYPPGTKGYKIYDIENKKMVVSRDVKFVEGIFPCAHVEMNIIDQEEDIFQFSFEVGSHKNKPPNDIGVKSYRCNDGVNIEDHTHTNVNGEPEDAHDDAPAQGNPTGPTQETQMHDELVDNVDPLSQTNNQEIAMDKNVNNEHVNDILTPQADSVEPSVRETRSKTHPKRLNDYMVKLLPSVDHSQPTTNQGTSTVHPLAQYVSYDKFSKSHKAFIAAINSHGEPKCFNQAVQDDKWKEAMKKEVQALEQNGTWTLEHLPVGKRAIDSKWVYKIKYRRSRAIQSTSCSKRFHSNGGCGFS